MKKKVAINGFGRIGRLVYRAFLERLNEFSNQYEISYINDLADIDSNICLLYTSPSPRDGLLSRMPSSA